MKPLRIIIRSIRDAFKSVIRNFSLSMASILCATITLMVVAIALVIAGNVNNTTDSLKKEMTIVVYLEESSTKEDLERIEEELKKDKKIYSVDVKSKENWKDEISASSPTYKTILEYYPENPLLDSLSVKVNNIEDIEVVTNQIRQMDKVSDANYYKDTVNNIVSAFDFIENVTIIVVISLVFVTTFLITNTIKLTIYSRREEIEIMRLVGASNMAIKLPFVVEGFVIGILGSIIPIIISIYGYIIIYAKLNGQIIGNVVPLISPYNYIFIIALIILGLGAIIGMLGSLNAVRKYLKI